MIRNIVVRNMKDIMFYNGVNVSLEEEGEEEEQTESEEEDASTLRLVGLNECAEIGYHR